MKELIRKWLGLSDLEIAFGKAMRDRRPESEQTIKERYGKALKALLHGELEDEGNRHWLYDYVQKSEFISVIEDASRNPAAEAVAKYVESEEFLDRVIDRIQRKQLK